MIKKEIPQCPITADKARVEIGSPAEKIAAIASQGDYDLVIMGTHGHGKLQETFVGSVARDVIGKCPVPVMVVRLPENRKNRWNRSRLVESDAEASGKTFAVK